MKKLLGILVLGLLFCNTGFTESNYNLNDPALNKCFKKMLGEERNINGFDITFGSNYTLMSEIPDYAVNLEISNKF